jgi:netrin receptor unc-5
MLKCIFISDLRREFETPPYSRQVALGSQVEMRCHPPKGKPTPTISWTKNGEAVEKNKNLLETGSGHLIVVKARWADAANYSCVAGNVAGRRISPTAQLTVYGKDP